MVLSNAERQARYRKNLKARAKGVTPDLVAAAVEAMYRYNQQLNADPRQPSWEDFVKSASRRGKFDLWRQWFDAPFDPETCDDISAAGFDGDLVARVWPVAYAVLRPPVP
jgi:hypothetical protein